MKQTIVLFCCALIAGCASGYSQFYKPVSWTTPQEIEKLRAAPPPATPEVHYSPTVPDIDTYSSYGYYPLGYAYFNSGRNESERGAISQGQSVGADLVVIVNPQYTETRTSHMQIVSPTTSTSHTTGTATAYGTYGSATAHGHSTTTTYGTETHSVPINVRRHDYGAVYFIRRSYVFGVNWRDLSNDERIELQSNRGLVITSVVQGTPAFYADILPGDILLGVDGQSIFGQSRANEILDHKRGTDVAVKINRNGELIEKQVRLNP